MRAFRIAAVTREDIKVFYGHIELVAARIGQHHAVVRGCAYGDGAQPFVAADAVVHMHHEVAWAERGEFGEEGVGALLALFAADEAVAQQILFGDKVDIGAGKAGFQRQYDRRDPPCCRHAQGLLPAGGEGRCGGDGLAQNAGDPRPAADGIAGEDGAFAGACLGLQVAGGGFVDVILTRAFGGEIAAPGETEIERGGAFRLGKAVGAVGGGGLDAGVKFAAREVERGCFQRAVGRGRFGRGFGAGGVVIGDVGEAFLCGGQRAVVDQH